MEKITRDEIDRLSDLSELTFSVEEKDAMVKDISDIISMLDECGEIDTSSTPEPKAVRISDLRTDTPKSNSIDALANCKNVEDNFFVVPRQVE